MSEKIKDKKIIIYGTGSTAQLLYSYLSRQHFDITCFTVESAFLHQDQLLGVPVFPFEKLISDPDLKGVHIMIGVGPARQNQIREARLTEAVHSGLIPVSCISPSAIIYSDQPEFFHCKIGDLTICQPFSQIGMNVFIGSASIIGHHAMVGDHTFIASGVKIAGHVKIGRYCFIGTGAVIRDNITIGNHCIIGAGVTLLHDAPDNSVWINNSAEMLPVESQELV
jgi:sugar O-acyltransferase (sialic acid O-acetyltransferase NeuD family)